MKTKFTLVLFLFLPLLLAACSSDDDDDVMVTTPTTTTTTTTTTTPTTPTTPTTAENTRTVLVYMAANNSLSSFSSSDISEMKEGLASMSSTEGMHLLVYIDTGSSPKLMELEMENGSAVETVVQTYESRNSCGVDETIEVFEDVFGNSEYEADSYGLVYWSHGDGWIPSGVSTRWVGQDTSNGTNYMDIDDLVTALQSAPHFDFILFDACFMASIEVAYEIRDYTDYYISSPTEIPGPGAPYDAIVPYMFQDGAAVQIASAYYSVYEDLYVAGNTPYDDNWTGGAAITALKSSALSNLASVTAKALSGVTADCSELRSSVFDYDKRSSSSHVGYYDFVGMMNDLVEDSSLLGEWLVAYNAALCYWSTTDKVYSDTAGMFSMEGTEGVSQYIPSSSTSGAATAYHSTSWYEAAGLSAIGF